jgi:hypothetical protein
VAIGARRSRATSAAVEYGTATAARVPGHDSTDAWDGAATVRPSARRRRRRRRSSRLRRPIRREHSCPWDGWTATAAQSALDERYKTAAVIFLYSRELSAPAGHVWAMMGLAILQRMSL